MDYDEVAPGVLHNGTVAPVDVIVETSRLSMEDWGSKLVYHN
jgi:hypothetical protein